jgi:RNA polymerase sigma factor (sigma-70 family)
MSLYHTFNSLYIKHNSMVKRIVRSTMTSQCTDLIQDVTQVIWLKVWTAMNKPSWASIDSGKLTHWLYRVSKRTALDAIKKELNRHEVVLPDSLSGWPDDERPTSSLSEVLTDAVAEAVGQLPARTREVIRGFYYRNMTVAEIAEEYEMPSTTVRWHLWEGRRLVESYITTERKK